MSGARGVFPGSSPIPASDEDGSTGADDPIEDEVSEPDEPDRQWVKLVDGIEEVTSMMQQLPPGTQDPSRGECKQKKRYK